MDFGIRIIVAWSIFNVTNYAAVVLSVKVPKR